MKGTVALQIDQNGRTYHISDSRGASANVDSPQALFDFLLIDYPNTFKVCWNIYQLVNLVGKILPESAFQTLMDKDRVEVEYNGATYRLFSSQGRVFSITKKWTIPLHNNFQEKHEVEQDIYHVAQFFPSQHVETLEDITAKGNELLKALDEMDLHPTKLSSSIAIYDEVLNSNYVPTIFTMNDAGLDFCDYASHLLSREWRCCYRIGHWPKAYDYDVRGAYPSVIANLGDTSDCDFWYAKLLQRCDFGVVYGEIDITSDYSPIVNREGKNVKGKYEDYFTTEQIGYLYFYKQGTFKIKDGWFLEFHTDDKPLFQIMNDLYTKRELGGVKKDFAKAVSVGIGGRLAEEHPEKFGNYYNPILSIMTTSRMSLKVGKFIENNNLEPNLISVVVDGTLCDKEIQTNEPPIMGNWKIEQVPALVLSLGYQFVGTKKPGNITYGEMMAEIKTHPNKTAYKGILLNPNMLNNNHVFREYPRRGNDLLKNIYESRAITL